jgi:hypothetical protein
MIVPIALGLQCPAKAQGKERRRTASLGYGTLSIPGSETID